MYAIFTMRKLQLTQRINNLQFKLMQISQKLQDLSVYAGNVADGVISPSEFLNSPASIFGVNMNFFNNSVPKALFEVLWLFLFHDTQEEQGFHLIHKLYILIIQTRL